MEYLCYLSHREGDKILSGVNSHTEALITHMLTDVVLIMHLVLYVFKRDGKLLEESKQTVNNVRLSAFINEHLYSNMNIYINKNSQVTTSVD